MSWWFALPAALGAVAVAGLAWGWFEAGWVRLRTIDLPVEGLPPELDGLRIAHLSDFHLGVPSRGVRAVERAVAWAEGLDPDLTLVTGDLLSRPRGDRRLRRLLPRLPRCYAVLGNHDFAHSRDPFSAPVRLEELEPATLLSDSSVALELRGRRVQLAGADPRTFLAGRPLPAVAPNADLRILLSHFPQAIDRIEPGSYQVVLAGHLHDGQICIPWPGGRLRLAHMGWSYERGNVYRRRGAVLHVSPGLGTTFVPFRFLARPEATLIRLASPAGGSSTPAEPGPGAASAR